MPLPRPLLGAGVAFRALFVEPCSTQLAPKNHQTTFIESLVLVFAPCYCSLLPCLFQEISSGLAWLFGLSLWRRCQPNSLPEIICPMLLRFASMPLSRALFGAGVAFRALFVERSQPKSPQKSYNKIYVFNCLLHTVFASITGAWNPIS